MKEKYECWCPLPCSCITHPRKTNFGQLQRWHQQMLTGHTTTCTQTTKSSRAENHDWLPENQDNLLLGKKLQNLLLADATRTNLKRVSVYQTINACKVWEGKEVYSWKRRWTKVCGLSPHSFGLFKVFSQLFGQLLLTSLDHQECWVFCISLFPRKCSRFAIGNLVVLQIDREDVKTRLLEYSMTAAVQDRGFVITPFVVALLRAWSEGGQKM